MATDFFERQSTARRNTKWLIWTFSLSVLAVLVTTFVVTAVAVNASEGASDVTGFKLGSDFAWQFPGGVTVASLALIAGGSLFKIAQLARRWDGRGRATGRAARLSEFARAR